MPPLLPRTLALHPDPTVLVAAVECPVDADGLPVIYDRAAIQAYWDKQGGALQQRWVEFLGVTVPFITRVASLLIGGGTDALEENASELARDARINLEKLGPTYIKVRHAGPAP